MKIMPQEYHRRSIRLKGYDYSLPGAYFVTLVTRGRSHLFGEISDGMMHRNHLGEIIRSVWQHLPDTFSIRLDEWVVMPNHLHGIIWIVNPDEGEASSNQGSVQSAEIGVDASPLLKPRGTQQASLGAVIQNFKSVSTRKIHPWLSSTLWQRDYFDRIIRDDKELDLIRLYISENPRQWADDPENPSHQQM